MSDQQGTYEIYYFGCRPGQKGHHLSAPGWSGANGEKIKGWPFGYAGGTLDGTYGPRSARQYSRDEQPQGHARTTIIGEWTVVTFWDRSEDPRGACNSNFVMRGLHRPELVLEIARNRFPEVFSRLDFVVKLEGPGWMP